MKITKDMIKKAAIMGSLGQLKTYEIGAKIEILEEAIKIFRKFAEEPMTGNVVIIELKGLIYKLREEGDLNE
jgi:hypothetical protein